MRERITERERITGRVQILRDELRIGARLASIGRDNRRGKFALEQWHERSDDQKRRTFSLTRRAYGVLSRALPVNGECREDSQVARRYQSRAPLGT